MYIFYVGYEAIYETIIPCSVCMCAALLAYHFLFISGSRLAVSNQFHMVLTRRWQALHIQWVSMLQAFKTLNLTLLSCRSQIWDQNVVERCRIGEFDVKEKGEIENLKNHVLSYCIWSNELVVCLHSCPSVWMITVQQWWCCSQFSNMIQHWLPFHMCVMYLFFCHKWKP